MSRDTLIPIRMNAEEIATLRAAAARDGLGLGPWLRMLGLREANAGQSVRKRSERRKTAVRSS